MRRWLWIPITLVLTFVGDRLAGGFLAQLTERSEFRYSRLYSDRGKADIVMIGNSRGLNFYQPFIEQQTGRTTLNLSYNAMPADLGCTLLDDYLQRYGAPQDLIVDVTFLDRDNSELEQEFRLYAPYSKGIDSLVHRAGNSIYYGTRVAHLTRYGGEVAQRMLFYLKKTDEDWLLDRAISPTMVQDAQQLEPYRSNYTDARIHRLKRTVDAYKSAGARVHFVINPYYPAFARSISNLDSLDARVEELTGVPVSNYATIISEDRYFGDYQHLNKEGALVYLQTLIEQLKLKS